MSIEISRRSFLKGAAAVGVAAAIAPVSITSSHAEEKAKTYLPQETYDISKTLDFDVVIVGAGGGGMSAAIRSAQLGMNPPYLGYDLFTRAMDFHHW